jgi:hypothetical protein
MAYLKAKKNWFIHLLSSFKTNTKVSCCHDFILKNNTCERQVSTWVIKAGKENAKKKITDTISY